MKKFILIALLVPIYLFSQVPQTINYQGLLEDSSGDPVADGNYTVIFTIYDAVSSGNSLWTETRTITTENGIFSLTLGESSPIDIETDAQLWLNVNVEGTDLTPRTKLAGNLTSLKTKSIENTQTAGNSVVEAINSSIGGISTDKINDGTVSNTEFAYLDNVASNIQSQLDGKQATLPSQSGNANKYLSTDGTSLSWQEATGGGGGSTTVTTLTVSSDITINSTSYIDITGISQSLDANSTYLIKGVLGAERQGTSCIIDIFFDYSGTANMNMFGIKQYSSDDAGLLSQYGGVTGTVYKHLINGMIDTQTSGTVQLRIKKNSPSTDDVKITDNTKILLIKIR